MLEKLLHQPRCFRSADNKIYWRWLEQDQDLICSINSWNTIIKECSQQLKLIEKPNVFQKRIGNFRESNNTYFITKSQDGKYMSIMICKDFQIAYCCTNRNYLFNADNIDKRIEFTKGSTNKISIGTTANAELNKRFKLKFGLKSNINLIFSGGEYKEQWTAIKNCVPKQITWISSVRRRVVSGCYKADISSAFPFQFAKDIPTLHGFKQYPGYVEPNEQYPFAFYLKSHHMAIYKELDTRIDCKSRYSQEGNSIYNDVNEDEEITLLLKRSKYNFRDIITDLYIEKSNFDKVIAEKAKLTMNACIGYFQFNKHPALCFISATVIARNNHRMLNILEQLNQEGNIPLYVATDSIVWTGKESTVATDKKFLGSFTYESKNVEFYALQIGAYQIRDGEKVTTKCSYIQNKFKMDIAFGELPEPKNSKIIVDSDGQILEV